jgi:hypothetical protein
MPDKRTHRGSHPEDAKLFRSSQIDNLRKAVCDYSMLLSKGYAEKSSLKLVGDKFGLTERQRIAVMRCGSSDEQLAVRRENEVALSEVGQSDIAIDGYNLLITIESALSGGFIFRGRDGCLRDLASIHGTYRKVCETIPAIELVGGCLAELGVGHCLWFFDSPVSNSGRLKTIMYEVIEKNNWGWDVELSQNPDKELIKTDRIVVTSDSAVLDKCGRWINLANYIIEHNISSTRTIDLSGGV